MLGTCLRESSIVRHAFTVLFVVALAVAESQAQGPAYSKQASLAPLLDVLDKAGVSGSLEFSGHCDSFNGPDFPKFTYPATSTASPVQAMREMFAHNPTIQVTQDPDGTIRMIQRGVLTDLLNVKIAHIPFETGRPPALNPIYSANAALVHIWVAPEVTRFMKDHDIEKPAFLATGTPPPSTPPPGMPYFSPHPLDDVTISQAMDYILKSFPGLWYYEDCPRTEHRNRIVELGFYHLQKTGLGDTVQ